MIKAIIFDMGGVILNIDGLKDKLMEIFNPKDEKKFWQEFSVFESPLCEGKISEEEFWSKVRNKFDIDILDNEIKDFWIDNFRKYIDINKNTLKLIESLKENYKLGLISNISENHAKVIKKMNILGDFDEIIFSNEVKMAKDNQDIFKLCVNRLGVGFEECVFIDDVKKFVEIADSLGMKGILFKDVDRLKKELDSLDIIF